MNCQKVQSLLSAYLDQELTTEERRIIRQHLFTCRACSLEYESLSLLKSSLGSLEPPAEPKDLLSKILLAQGDSGSALALSRIAFNPWAFGKKFVMAAACVFLFLGASLWLFPTPKSNPMLTTAAPQTPRPASEEIIMVKQMDREEDSTPDDRRQETETKPAGPQHPLLMGIPVSR
ncbi:MAG TPA: zf-HC2 domain-containing protein [Bacillota bacterium]